MKIPDEMRTHLGGKDDLLLFKCGVGCLQPTHEHDSGGESQSLNPGSAVLLGEI
jgi:hypothetical protein